MKKRSIIIIIIVSCFLILGVIMFFMSAKQGTQDSSPTLSPGATRSLTMQHPSIQRILLTTPVPTAIPTSVRSDALTPEQVARNVYSWYITYPGVSALTSGAYMSNTYISDKFKRIISLMAPYPPSDPVFCQNNKTTSYTITAAEQMSNARDFVLIQSFPDQKNLYKIVLVNTNGQWFVDDTVCIP